ncbi:MAG: hypothetical protein LV480_09780 [Methylacidiphilales bacterium]|nr:hypothetical protein [Candidatus Methylacidiphilales bacterium]
MASDSTIPANPASAGPEGLSTPATPAVMALPADATPLSGDASSTRKFYTITASLREIYDTNVDTTHSNPQTSLETELSPSILVDFPTEDSDFSARYTLDTTYYANVSNNNNNNNNNTTSGTLQYNQEFNAQYNHTFSERLQLNLAEDFRYFYEPSLFQSVGTNYQNGNYIANIFNGTVTMQWLPRFSTQTTYSNTIVRYNETSVGNNQNNNENTGSQVFIFTLFPKISLTFGGIGDGATYLGSTRGYTAYTGFVGAQWQPLPSLNLSGRVGGTYTETDLNQTLITPYTNLSIDWTLGARSELTFNYTHEVVPTDLIGADAETADRVSSNFRYDITPNLSTHLQGILTNVVIPSALANSNSNLGNNYTEIDYALDTGFTYHYNSYLDFNCGITLSGVSADISTNGYNRSQTYLGVRGTY